MRTNLRIRENDWTELRKLVASSFRSARRAEKGAIGLLGYNFTKDRRELLVTKIIWPNSDDIKTASAGRLEFSSSYVRRAHLEARISGLSGIVTFHTHPYSDDSVGFSGFDSREDAELMANLEEIHPGTFLCSVVLGRTSQAGCLRTFLGGRQDLSSLVVVGERLQVLALDGKPMPSAPPAAAFFDRALALSSTGALAILSEMVIVVVGVGGTGSLLCELLARSGAKKLIVIDHDVMADVNVNRVLYSTVTDVSLRVHKVDVIKRIEQLGLGVTIETIKTSVLDADVWSEVRRADVVFGCVDRGLPRQLLSLFSRQFLRPYIDLGSEIGLNQDGVASLDSRVSFVNPSRPCLKCTGVVSGRQLAFESQSKEERSRIVALGYSDDLILKQPAVMELNMRSASTASLLLRDLLQPTLLRPLPLTFLENALTYSTRRITTARTPSTTCAVCAANPHTGFGECGPEIGFSTEIAKDLTDAA